MGWQEGKREFVFLLKSIIEKPKKAVLLLGIFLLGWNVSVQNYASAAGTAAEETGAAVEGNVQGEETVPETDPEEEMIHYVALGDSIANGYYGENEPEVLSYPALITGDLEEISGRDIDWNSFAKDGLTTKKLNSVILQDPMVQEQIGQADLITVTIGSNDLLNEFKKVSREILNNETHFSTADEAVSALLKGIEENPLLLVNVASAIGEWDYSSFEEQWLLAMDTICFYRSSESQMAVTTIYNPMENRELPGTLNVVIESVISKMNEVMQNHAEEYDYQVVDLLGSGIEENTQSDGLHPNQEGQNMIRELMEYELDLDVFYNEEADEEVQKEMEEAQRKLEEAAERKAREAEQKRQDMRRRRIFLAAGIAGIVILFAAGMILLVRKGTRRRKNPEKMPHKRKNSVE